MGLDSAGALRNVRFEEIMRTSAEINLIAGALAKAQGEMKNPETNKQVTVPTKTGSKYSYNYADLAASFDSARKALADCEIAHVCSLDVETGTLFYRLIHSSGQWIESTYPIQVNADPKSLAGAMTYGKRYLFNAMVGLAADDDVDTGEHEPQAKVKGPVIAPKVESDPKPIGPFDPHLNLIKELVSLTELHKIPMDQVKEFIETKFQIESLKNLNSNQLYQVMDWVKNSPF